CIAAIDVDDVTAVSVKRTDGKLIAKQIELALDEIEQRADARVCLTVVIAQVAFVISSQARDTPVRQQLPVIREPLVEFEFKGFVLVHWIGETVRDAINAEFASQRIRVIADRAKNVTTGVGHGRDVERYGARRGLAGRRNRATNRVGVRDGIDYPIK